MKRTLTRFAAVATLAFGLGACGSAEEETVYEPAVEDLSGGELQMADPDAEGVAVELPETEMTNVPPETMTEEMPDDSEAAE
ncbi:hypothetical protein [Aurantiacibacter marinus]|uniref:Argininosuccinate lyase n=1 Tax=Aurantiacibacter marinus TaxID=874156 RepID=A0A0H0XRD0_9SPHN|nr:hypothetical protein [Aurantiacibacter marinus]KLI65183.1 hypothetical protein AAV99_02915 [Aurantiacibacter marinus]